jgi:ATP-dependent Lhr-like helicase
LITLVPAGGEDLLPAADQDDLDEAPAAVWQVMERGGGWFFRELVAHLPQFGADTLEKALWDLLWRSMITNDSLEPVRRLRSPGRPRRARTAALPMPGRWSAVQRPMAADRGLLWAQTLLDRYGLVDRTVVGNERVPGGFHGLFAILRRLDEAGRVQQVYAVEGLGGAQFATAAALEQLRQQRTDQAPVLIAATDPANPLGITVPWPSVTGGRPTRKAGSTVLLGHDGPLFYLDPAGRSLLAWTEPDAGLAASLHEAVRANGRRTLIRRINGEPVFGSPWSSPLQDAGFRLTPSGLR